MPNALSRTEIIKKLFNLETINKSSEYTLWGILNKIIVDYIAYLNTIVFPVYQQCFLQFIPHHDKNEVTSKLSDYIGELDICKSLIADKSDTLDVAVDIYKRRGKQMKSIERIALFFNCLTDYYKNKLWIPEYLKDVTNTPILMQLQRLYAISRYHYSISAQPELIQMTMREFEYPSRSEYIRKCFEGLFSSQEINIKNYITLLKRSWKYTIMMKFIPRFGFLI